MLRWLRIRSIRTVFLLVMTLLVMVLCLPLLYSGIRIMDMLIDRYGVELLTNELSSRLAVVDGRYATLRRIGLEDSQVHRREIMDAALSDFARYRYKQSGTLFVIGVGKKIFLSSDFKDGFSPDFESFFNQLQERISPVTYQVAGVSRLAVVRYYEPWQSFVGLAMDSNELFAPRNLFLRINLLVLALVLFVALGFTLWLQRNLVAPLINLSRFAGSIGRGDSGQPPTGRYILELQDLKNDILKMVEVLRAKMRESSRQLQRIRENEERYRTIFNAPSDAIIIHDPQTGAMLEVNDGAIEMFGYSAEEFTRITIADISSGVSPFSEKEAGEKIRQVVELGSLHFEWQGRKKDGSLFWLDVILQYRLFGDDSYVIAVVRDIDERKQAEFALSREKEQLAVTLRSIGDGVITTDLEGKVALINQVAEKLTGWSQKEAFGRDLSEVFSVVNERTGEPMESPAQEVLRTGKVIELANHTMLVSRQGRKYSIADSAAPIHDLQEHILGVVVVFRDVTEKNRMEKELLKVKKLESVGVLAGGIAHDFNNILAVILGNVSLARLRLQKEGAGGGDVDTLLEKTENAGHQAQNLTSQLLTFSKGGDPVRQTASIAEILQQSAEFVLHGSSVDCDFDLADDLWFVEVDPGQISQVVQNIILNARQAMPGGGHISVSATNCRNCEKAPEAVRGYCVKVVIADNGPGMSAEVLEKIFDPYFSTRSTGSGLGLAICHSIMEKHNGTIQVESTLGQGTVFTLILPVSEEVLLQHREEEEDVETDNSLRVLLMDDEKMIRDLARSMLRFLGHQVETVADGREAVARYREALESGVPFDVVILDLTVPGGMGGKEAAARLLELDPRVKLIVSSGYSNDPVVSEYRSYGFIATMSKPYDMKTIQRVLSTLFPPDA